MTTTTETEAQNRTSEAVAFIDAWLSEHSWWADTRSIDFALDVRAVLAEPMGEGDEETTDESLTAAATSN